MGYLIFPPPNSTSLQKQKIRYYTRCCILDDLENSFCDVLYHLLTQSLKFLQVTYPYYVYKLK